jgi:hypothetical protein
LGHASFGRLHSDQMHAVEFVTDVAPGDSVQVFRRLPNLDASSSLGLI